MVTNKPFDGFWMSTAYRIPDNACACVAPGTKPQRSVPIARFDVRSFITNLADGARVPAGRRLLVRGIAFDGGHGITDVALSTDGGRSWQGAQLGQDLGRYAFRQWQAMLDAPRKGAIELKVRAINRIGQSQPMQPLWNPSGYMRNVVETTRIEAV